MPLYASCVVLRQKDSRWIISSTGKEVLCPREASGILVRSETTLKDTNSSQALRVSHLWELNNCATYFLPFANVNQTHKGAMVLLVALEPHGNHSSTPRDWPWQIKWKTQRKDLKIPKANKEVILQIYCSKQVETRICSSVGELCWFTQGRAST